MLHRRRRAFARSCAAAACTACLASTGQAQVRIANYNVAQLKGDTGALQAVLAAMATDDSSGFAVAPHVLVFQEVRSADVESLEDVVAAAFPDLSFTRATFTSSASEDAAGGAQALFYRADTLTEISSAHKDLDTGANRKSDRWRLELNGYSSSAAKFYIYASHLKASPGRENEAIRLAGAEVIRNDADSLPEGTHILYCGDFNLYSNTEPAYLEYLSAGPGQALDPLGSGSWSGSSNAVKHTQSPRDITAKGLVGGGMDDRFDFQLSSAEMQDGNGLAVVPGSYRAFGNDGQHYNLAINNGTNSFWPDDLPSSNLLADALFDATDHIPVLCDYQVPAVMSTSMAASFGKVVQFASMTVDVEVSNVAIGVPMGVDTLDVQVQGTGALSGLTVASAPLSPAAAFVPLAVNTSTVGPKSGGAVITALSEGTQAALQIVSTSGTVVRPSHPSFSGQAHVDMTTVSTSVTEGTVGAIPVSIFNYLFDTNQALLDVDLVGGLTGRFSLSGPLPQGVGGTPGTLPLAFDAIGAAPGAYQVTLTLFTSDEDIPGSTDGELVVTVSVTVAESSNPADLNSDGTVDGADLAIVLGAWLTAGPGDLTGDGIVDGADLAIVLGAWS